MGGGVTNEGLSLGAQGAGVVVFGVAGLGKKRGGDAAAGEGVADLPDTAVFVDVAGAFVGVICLPGGAAPVSVGVESLVGGTGAKRDTEAIDALLMTSAVVGGDACDTESIGGALTCVCGAVCVCGAELA